MNKLVNFAVESKMPPNEFEDLILQCMTSIGLKKIEEVVESDTIIFEMSQGHSNNKVTIIVTSEDVVNSNEKIH